MPVTAVDSHAHIFDPRRPFAPDRTYTPDPGQVGSAARFLSVLDHHGVSHALVVAAEPYGTDNTAMLDGIALGGGRLKGIALVAPDAGPRKLDALAGGGVIGVRYNLTSYGMRQFEHPDTPRLFEQIKERAWFLQIHCEKDQLAPVAPMLKRSGVRLMVDHIGRPDVACGTSQPGFQALLDLGRTGRAILKLSGAFRSSRQDPPYADVEPFIEAAVAAFTLDNCVWGSDWPFVKVAERLDYGPEFACLERWFPDSSDRDRILRANPARLFGFS